jgi:hypothetical protein
VADCAKRIKNSIENSCFLCVSGDKDLMFQLTVHLLLAITLIADFLIAVVLEIKVKIPTCQRAVDFCV